MGLRFKWMFKVATITLAIASTVPYANATQSEYLLAHIHKYVLKF